MRHTTVSLASIAALIAFAADGAQGSPAWARVFLLLLAALVGAGVGGALLVLGRGPRKRSAGFPSP